MEPYSPLIAIESAKYDTPGKQKFRELLLAIAGTSDVRTYGTLWGGGTDARMAAAAGLQVTAAEVTRSLHEAMTNDAALHGYVPFTHRAGRLTEHFDMFHADFCGNASPGNFRELRHLASISRRWLAVTLAPDHQLDPSMQGEAAIYTIPAWLTGATGFTLEYLARYVRNDGGQTMWTAILQHREGRGTHHQVLPIQVSYSIRERDYWASRRLYGSQLLPHRYAPRNEREKATGATYYQANRERYQERARSVGENRRSDPEKYARDLASSRSWRKSERGRTWWREYDRRRRQDPKRAAQMREYKRQWYIRKKASGVSGTPDKAIKAA